MEPIAARLVERVALLEHQQAELLRANGRLRMLTIVLIMLTGAVVVMGQAAPIRSYEAQQFVLRGKDGTVRGSLGVTDNGAVGINFNDSKGQTRIDLDVAANGSPGLDLYDADGRLRATLALGPEGVPGLGLYDPSGKLRSSLNIPAANTPGLAFYRPDGAPAWGAP
jgi:hypothetical protein